MRKTILIVALSAVALAACTTFPPGRTQEQLAQDGCSVNRSSAGFVFQTGDCPQPKLVSRWP
jgi:hypothetical protein